MKNSLRILAILAAFLSSINHVCSFTLRMTCRAKGIEMELCKELVDEWTKETGVDVEIITLPHSSNECFALYQQILCSGQCDLDVILLDSAWTAVFADQLEDLSNKAGMDTAITEEYFPAIKSSIIADQKLIALPMYTDVGVLFYRKDLLDKYGFKPPETWNDLYNISIKIQQEEKLAGNEMMYGYVFQAKASEMLTCIVVETLASYNIPIVNTGIVNLDYATVKEVVELFQKFSRYISPVGISNHTEEESRGIFQSGNAVFMRNWPYAAMCNTCSKIAGNVGISVLPKGVDNGSHSAAIGGWNLGIPKLSKNKELAINLLKHMSSKIAQKRRAVKGHYAPAFKDLYNDNEILKANPHFCFLHKALESAVPRPSKEFGRYYPKASNLISEFMNFAISNCRNSSYNLEVELNKLNRSLNCILKKNQKR